MHAANTPTGTTPTPSAAPRAPITRRPALAAAILALTLLTPAAPAPAQMQGQSPVYLDDSPAASEAIQRAGELAGVGNLAEAAAVLQKVIEDFGESVIPDPEAGEPDVYITVRRCAHEMLLSSPALLERYRALNAEPARRALDAGQEDAVERHHLLTPSGFDAALLLAQDHFEAARFDAALLTLEQLDEHPDRVAQRAAQAADMLTRVARYARDGADAGLWAWAERWRADANLPAPDDRTPAQRPTLAVPRDPFNGAQPVALDSLLPRPLASDTIGEPIEAITQIAVASPSRGVPESTLVLHAAPTVSNDTVYVNDGERISAWDRFTLTLKWRRRIEATNNPNQQVYAAPAMLEDMSRIVLREPLAIAVTGFSLLGRPGPERTVTVFDTHTGNPLWSRTVTQMSPNFEDSMLRGAPVVDQGTVVAAVLKQSQQRRLVGVSLVGLDLATGDTRWVRTLGSIGALPWGTWRFGGGDEATAHHGLIYRADRLGVVAALEIFTGRVRWLRRVAPELLGSGMTAGVPQWSTQQPLIHNNTLITLSPDRRVVLLLEPLTGRTIRQVLAARLGQPDYLLLAGDLLLSISSARIHAVDLSRADWHQSEPWIIAELAGSGLRGRVVVAGSQLVLPISEGLRVIELSEVRAQAAAGTLSPLETGRIVPLEAPGTALPLESQVLVVDDARIHSYLLWNVAESLLRQRMTDNPGDAEAPITYAELSFQAAKLDRVLPAVDAALAAIERDPLSPQSDRSRSRLFRTLLDMVEPTPRGPAAAKLSDDQRAELVDRLSRAAADPAEQVAYLLAAGRFAESSRQPQLAAERYQQILDTPALTGETYTSRQTTVPADVEATRRLRDLVRRHGPEVYAAFEQDAARRLDELGPDAAGEQFEAIARRFPLARSAPRAWSLAADRYMADGRTELGLFALDEGARTAADTLAPEDPLTGELAARLITRLRDAGRIIPAMRALEAIRRDQPALQLTDSSGPIDADALLAELRTDLAKLHPQPDIGPDLQQAVPLAGWSVVDPVCSPTPAAPTDAVIMGSAEGALALFRIQPGGEAVKLWTVEPRENFLFIDARAAYFGKPLMDAAGLPDQIVIARDLVTGQPRWTSPPIRTVFAKDPRFADPRRLDQVDTPLRSTARFDDMYLMFDASTAVIIERTGRGLAYDLDSGKLLWTTAGLLGRVHDAALNDGVVIIGGADELPGPRPGIDITLRPVAVALEARTGRVLLRHEESHTVRWVRLTPEGHALVGHDNGLVLLDIFRRTARWRNDSPPLARTVEAWPTPGLIIVRDNQNDLWGVDSDTGQRSDNAIDTHGRMDPDFRRVAVEHLGDRTIVGTMRGFAALDASGTLVAADSRPGEMLSLLPAFSRRIIVTIERAEDSITETDLTRFRLGLYDAATGRAINAAEALLPSDPFVLRAVDHAILISSGSATLVIPAPADASP